MNFASEKDFAIRLANTVLDDANRDPDGDISVLARQFLRALEPKWQPIETAPKDGVRVLAWAPDSMFGTPFTAHWVDDEFDAEDSGWFENEDGTGRAVDVEITQWQPLPEAPQ